MRFCPRETETTLCSERSGLNAYCPGGLHVPVSVELDMSVYAVVLYGLVLCIAVKC